jgi:orotidine-5'-phosphate decarboxylase
VGKDVIIACDFPAKEDTFLFLDKFKDIKPFIKIGMELYYSEGPEIVKEIKARGHKIFLDLKLHDIPNTVKRAMSVISKFNIDMCNLHASGTSEMMKAALEGITREDGTKPILIAVTQLTSINQKNMQKNLLIDKPIDEVVMHYAYNAKKSGLDGVVCSPHESKKVHKICGEDFITVTPGIRFKDSIADTFEKCVISHDSLPAAGEERAYGQARFFKSSGGCIKDDQARIMTPSEAKKAGSDYIVIGRPITASEDPVSVYKKSLSEFLGLGVKI